MASKVPAGGPAATGTYVPGPVIGHAFGGYVRWRCAVSGTAVNAGPWPNSRSRGSRRSCSSSSSCWSRSTAPGREEAVASATEVTRISATGVIAPLVDDAVLRGDGAALAALDRRVRASVLQEPVLRMTVYRPDGSVVYSSNPDYPPPAPTCGPRWAKRRAFTRTSGPRDPGADVPQDVQLLDVYQPVTTPAGEYADRSPAAG